MKKILAIILLGFSFLLSSCCCKNETNDDLEKKYDEAKNIYEEKIELKKVNIDYFRDEDLQPEVSKPYFNNIHPKKQDILIGEDEYRNLEDFYQEPFLEEENLETLNPDKKELK